MIILPFQEYDPIFDDTSEWANNEDNDMSQQPTSSRFHKRGSANSAFPDKSTDETHSRFRRRNNSAVSPSQPSEPISDNITQTAFHDEDDFFPMENISGPLSDSEDLFKDDSEKSSSSKSLAGFFILTAFLVVAVCATFLIKSRLSNRHSELTVPPKTTETAATAPTTVPDTDATQGTVAAPAETQTTTAATSDYQTLKTGDKNKDVKKMQERLLKLGYIGQESCTGYFGEYTEKIVKRFQKKAGLEQTGIADNETLTRLYADDAPKWR